MGTSRDITRMTISIDKFCVFDVLIITTIALHSHSQSLLI
jgi:hypothetical protein